MKKLVIALIGVILILVVLLIGNFNIKVDDDQCHNCRYTWFIRSGNQGSIDDHLFFTWKNYRFAVQIYQVWPLDQ